MGGGKYKGPTWPQPVTTAQITIMIAHRLSTIRNADYIYLIDDGVIKESGTWNSLLKMDDGIFRKLYNAQS